MPHLCEMPVRVGNTIFYRALHLYEMPVKVGNAIFYRTLHLYEMPVHRYGFVHYRYPAGNNPVRDCSSVETFDRTTPRMTSVMRTNAASL
ncbi:MAG: hypothetical protein LBG45_00005 [Dysgonamonadaceae bacterium]|nr:hypothetical protein [Dysgonamonadaceae bacterium]